MEQLFFLTPFMPFFAMLPPSLAAAWIAGRWLKTRGTTVEIKAEITALRDEVMQLRQLQGETQERLDFAERLLSQVREGRRELPGQPS